MYDIEEDSNYFYIIEEFLKGESLYSLVNRSGCLSRAKMISYGIQLCQLIYYLHSFEPNPILYLDLQPKNLLICQSTLKLVDFDQAVVLSQRDFLNRRFGTDGFAAPEQYTDIPLDERTDIYAIGAILYYLGTGMTPDREHDYYHKEWGWKLSSTIGRCLCREKEGRYESAAQLCSVLEKLQEKVFKYHTTSSLIIALVGSKSGIGTTHASLGLSIYLTKKGYPNIYEEKNTTGAANAIKDYYKAATDQYGVFCVENCRIRPLYGENVKLDIPEISVIIQDYGTDLLAVRDRRETCIPILVCGCRCWEQEYTYKALDILHDADNLCLIFNCFSAGETIRLPKQARTLKCFGMPYFGQPFHPDADAEDFYRLICEKGLNLGPGKGRYGKWAPGVDFLSCVMKKMIPQRRP